MISNVNWHNQIKLIMRWLKEIIESQNPVLSELHIVYMYISYYNGANLYGYVCNHVCIFGIKTSSFSSNFPEFQSFGGPPKFASILFKFVLELTLG